ncbi:hypothetical protein NYR97_02515 [Xanthomonas hydrangeae]|uniref:Secreted protein n=1 Tax=Xanthomonas hydrangeae TaxID=2775159 RepID=A0AAU0BE57_9XANT|nr:hypothetical protein [Xanthomonas hydrangeae]WOB50313.1 hypothetical protein NYR97_02515 [Xanthomonas hydrangeae]
MSMRNLLNSAALMSLVFTAQAATSASLDVRKPFAEQAAQVRTELSSGAKYSEISQEDRAKVLSALTRIEIAVAEHSDVEKLPLDRKVAIYNEQELVNTILTKAGEESRLICLREKATGSHRSSTVCQTVAERRRSRDQGERDLTTAQRVPKIIDPNR